MPAHVFASDIKSIACCFSNRLENRNNLSVNEKATGAWIWSTNRPKKFWHRNTCGSFINGCCHGNTKKKKREKNWGIKKDESSLCERHSVVIILVVYSQFYNNNNLPEYFCDLQVTATLSFFFSSGRKGEQISFTGAHKGHSRKDQLNI